MSIDLDKLMAGTVYLVGPMSGYPDWNYPVFHAYADLLRSAGFTVGNPAEHFGGDTTLPYETYIAKSLEEVAKASAVFALPGWMDSKGARAEVHVASVLGIPVFEAVGLAPGEMPGDMSEWHPVRLQLDLEVRPSDERPLPPASQSVLAQAYEVLAAIDGAREAAEATDAPSPRSRPGQFDYAGLVDGKGYKGSMDDPAKLPMALVPPAFIRAAARAMQHGARKYAPNNWMRGMAWTEPYSALQRHMLAWLEGEDADPESGLSHLDHAAACLAFLAYYEANRERYGHLDDRVGRQAGRQ